MIKYKSTSYKESEGKRILLSNGKAALYAICFGILAAIMVEDSNANSWGVSVNGVGFYHNSGGYNNGCNRGFTGGIITYGPPPAIYTQPYRNWSSPYYAPVPYQYMPQPYQPMPVVYPYQQGMSYRGYYCR